MTFIIRKAERKQAKLRIGVSGPSGSGKTYSALLLARGLTDSWEKVGLIDTENGSGELYSHLGDYNVITLEAPFTPERYIEAIAAFQTAGIEALVIDSTSHEWEGTGGCLDIVDKLGGKYQDWGKVTPRHNAFIQSILQSDMHIITTTRRKQDYEMTKDNNGKVKVEKMGLKEVQRDGFEYELTLALNIDTRHFASTSKDRTGLFMDKPEFIITEKTGEQLKEWASSGKAVDPKIKEKQSAIFTNLKALGFTLKTADDVKRAVLDITGLELAADNFDEIIKSLVSKVEEKKTTPPAETKTDAIVNGQAVEIKTGPVDSKVAETQTKAYKIAELEESIKYEQEQYRIAQEHPTDTAMFRKGLAKTAKRIEDMQFELSELKKDEAPVAPQATTNTTPQSKLDAALAK